MIDEGKRTSLKQFSLRNKKVVFLILSFSHKHINIQL